MSLRRTSWAFWCLSAMVLAPMGCGDDDGPPADASVGDGGTMLDAPPAPDSGTEEDGGTTPDSGTDEDAGPQDGGASVCHDDRDCPAGRRCESGECVPDGSCCETIRCGPGSFCDPTVCGCVGAGGCCDTGECSDPMKYCEFETCGCVDIPTCDPPCEGETVCDWGECVPRCWSEGCPDPSMICGETGCVT